MLEYKVDQFAQEAATAAFYLKNNFCFQSSQKVNKYLLEKLLPRPFKKRPILSQWTCNAVLSLGKSTRLGMFTGCRKVCFEFALPLSFYDFLHFKI